MKLSIKINLEERGKKLISAWFQYFRYVFIFLFLGALIFNWYLWRYGFELSRWDDERIRDYVSSKLGVELREDDFMRIINESKKREIQYQSSQSPLKNIFKKS